MASDWSWANLIGPAAAGITQYFGQREANETNKDIARDQMEFQERMSSSAHQREVKDLVAAGLNPILSTGTGASTPSGATAHVENAAEGLSATAMDMARMRMDQKKQNAEIDLLHSQKNLSEASATKARTESAVLQKELPRADITNKLYDVVRPWVDKIHEAGTSSATPKRESPALKREAEKLRKKYEDQQIRDGKQKYFNNWRLP